MSVAPQTDKPRRWGMVVDLNRCVGCQTCTIACKHTNDTPPGVQWRRVLDVEQGQFPDVQRFFLVTGCQHCNEPPCVPVCPTGATRQREDGLVTMDYDLCIGCAYCAVSCPYQARTIVHEWEGYFGQGKTKQEEAVAHPERVGVAQKCTFCQPKVDEGLARGLMPGVDPEATPSCASACIAQAIRFGDFNDEGSNVSQLVKSQPSLQLNAQLGTDPQIRYLYTTPVVPGRPAVDAGAAQEPEHLEDPAHPLTGPVQAFWDWRAAMNWIFGGMGAGLCLVTVLLWGMGALAAAQAAWFVGASALMVSAGLFFVFLKIGRKLRFWRAASRPQSSWMTRELYAAVVFYAAVLATLVAPGAGSLLLAGAAAAAFLYCQARILHRARGVPAWRVRWMPWLLGSSGLLEGWGAAMLGLGATGMAAPGWMAGLGIALAAIHAALWRRYVGTARAEGIPPLSRAVLQAISMPLHLSAHLPVMLGAALVLMAPPAVGLAGVLAGVAAMAGGAAWKYAVIVRASHMQGFTLETLPHRGSGTRAAPARPPAKPAAA